VSLCQINAMVNTFDCAVNRNLILISILTCDLMQRHVVDRSTGSQDHFCMRMDILCEWIRVHGRVEMATSAAVQRTPSTQSVSHSITSVITSLSSTSPNSTSPTSTRHSWSLSGSYLPQLQRSVRKLLHQQSLLFVYGYLSIKAI